MVSIKKVQKELSGIFDKTYTGTAAAEKKARKADERRLKFLRSVIAYLETSPREDFMRTQYEKTKERLALYKRMIVVRLAKGNTQAAKLAKKGLDEEFNPKALRSQIEFLEFIFFG